MIRAQGQKCKEFVLALHLLLNCETNHQRAEHIPEEVQDAIMEEYCRDKPPNLVLFRDVVGEFGLKRVQGTNPTLLVPLFVPHDRGIHDLRQDKHADAEEDKR